MGLLHFYENENIAQGNNKETEQINAKKENDGVDPSWSLVLWNRNRETLLTEWIADVTSLQFVADRFSNEWKADANIGQTINIGIRVRANQDDGKAANNERSKPN